VVLDGEMLDLEAVCELFAQSAHVTIRRESDQFFLTEPSLAMFPTDAERHARVVEIVELVNGAARLQWANHRALTVGSKLVTIAADGSRHEGIVIRARRADARSRAGSATVLIDGVPAATPPPLPPRWVEAALTDADAAAALRIVGDPDVTWSRLYHVFEIIKTDVGSSAMDQWSTQRQRERFTSTGNNRITLGDDARHGHKGWKPPANPMELGEARTLVRAIVAGWLTSRLI
jgi:hypothetical protein